MKRVLLILLLIIPFTLTKAQFSGGTRYLPMPVQFVVVNGDFNEAIVYLRRGGETVSAFKGQKNMTLHLDYNADYQIDFTKPGHITKSIRVNTAVPEERRKLGFDSYKIGVRLFKQYEGVNIVIYNQPVAFIKYLPEFDEIGYDTDYTRSILSLLTETENLLETKAKEELIALKEEKKAKKAVKPAPALAETPKPLLISEQKPEAANVQKPDAPKINLKDSLIVSAVEKVLVNEPKKEAKPKTPVQSGSDPSSGSDKKSGDEKAVFGGGEDGTDHLNVIKTVQSGKENREVMLSKTDTISREIKEIVEPNRVITLLRIKEGDQMREYRSVKYNWGGVYYFMDENYSISEELFNYLINSGISK